MRNRICLAWLWRTIVVSVLVLNSIVLNATVDAYEFADDSQRSQFYRVIDQLRCPKCQNQNIAGSDAPIAKDIRGRVHNLIQQGKSDDEIVAFMESRFGEFVNYKPPFRAGTWGLWLGPPFLLIAVVAWQWRRRKLLPMMPLTDEEQQRLERVLAQALETVPMSRDSRSGRSV